MSRVLVAGGAGFLGAAVARQLLGAGDTVVVLDTFDDAGDGRALKEERLASFGRHARLSVVRGDGTDAETLERVFAEHRPSGVVNTMRLPLDAAGIGPLVEASRQAGIGLLVHLSDAALYGPRDEANLRARENEAIEPGDDRDLLAKAAEEEALLASGLPFVILRVFAATGPGGGPARFPQDALEAVLAGEEAFLADDAPRDFVHPQDVVRGVLSALKKRPIGEILNLGFGLAVKPSEVVRALAVRAAKECRLTVTGTSARAPRIADMEKAWQMLGFSPQLGLGEIVWDTVRARLFPAEAARDYQRSEAATTAPADPPKPVSRRELFGMFRRPFDTRKKPGS
ncbi:MAG: NAD-dependent epimerase/dehydratase family protein [Acidobacteriota bacterium]|nr:NAD-dependent epimerase/dehydratase family protein [Acidobacteriota bacterium]